MLFSNDYDWSERAANLNKTQNKWMIMSCILGREVVDAITLGIFFKAVVSSILLFGSEMWVVDSRLIWVLVIFHNWQETSETAI